MNFKRLITKKNTLIIVLVLLSTNLFALDKIELIWYAWSTNALTKSFFISATEGKTFTVKWGDGMMETAIGEDELFLSHTYSTTGAYTVLVEALGTDCRFSMFAVIEEVATHLSFTDCTNLELLFCVFNNLSNIDLSGCPNLKIFDCSYNLFSNLNLSDCPALEELYCTENIFSTLDLTGPVALKSLYCDNNHLTKLDLSGYSSLENVWCENNHLTELRILGCVNLRVLKCGDNQLTHLDLSDCSHLQILDCSYNQFPELDVTGSVNLQGLFCYNNELTDLDLTKCSSLERLECYHNQLQLSNLFAAHSLIENQDYKQLGEQTLPPKSVSLDTWLFSDQSIFGGVYTRYVVKKDDAPAPESDYSVTDGKLIFHTTGIYTVTMTNDAIISDSDYPAHVIITFEVVPLSVPENEPAKLTVYPNPTTGELRVKSKELRVERVELFDIYGRKCLTTHCSLLNTLNISHLPAGIYFLRAAGQTVKVVKQ